MSYGTKAWEADGNIETSISVSQNYSLDQVIFNVLRIISVNLDTYSPTACGCKVGMHAWQHISSVHLAAAATTNLSVKHFNLECFFRRQAQPVFRQMSSFELPHAQDN